MTDESHPITWDITFRFYWTIVWRTFAMYALGFTPLFLWLMVDARLDDPSYLILRFATGWVLLLGASFIAVRMALRKRYRGFRIQVSRERLS
ncbi:hypothetical protein CQ12_19885 [Bradyrhizobium jicamae]|uniref:Uncharacterized protein n=1 Tax=Bradyrhizobium jicamae TaxID=280332 RepID=A0A0R3LDM0_9BRAD|nr:hypothetical protein CQ12_19885 [Bradyrhizobium jicamae]